MAGVARTERAPSKAGSALDRQDVDAVDRTVGAVHAERSHLDAHGADSLVDEILANLERTLEGEAACLVRVACLAACVGLNAYRGPLVVAQPIDQRLKKRLLVHVQVDLSRSKRNADLAGGPDVGRCQGGLLRRDSWLSGNNWRLLPFLAPLCGLRTLASGRQRRRLLRVAGRDRFGRRWRRRRCRRCLACLRCTRLVVPIRQEAATRARPTGEERLAGLLVIQPDARNHRLGLIAEAGQGRRRRQLHVIDACVGNGGCLAGIRCSGGSLSFDLWRGLRRRLRRGRCLGFRWLRRRRLLRGGRWWLSCRRCRLRPGLTCRLAWCLACRCRRGARRRRWAISAARHRWYGAERLRRGGRYGQGAARQLRWREQQCAAIA